MENRPKPQIPINSVESYPNASTSRRMELEKPKTKPKQEAIIKEGAVSTKKQSAWRKAKHRIFEQEGKELKNYIINDVLIPSAKETISTMVSNGIDILLYGEARHVAQRKPGILGGSRYGNYVSYNSISSNRTGITTNRPGMASAANLRESLSLDDFIFETRDDANKILSSMSDILSVYNVVTVTDLYDLCKLKSHYTYNNYGWNDLSTAGVTLTRDGYLLNLPTPYAID